MEPVGEFELPPKSRRREGIKTYCVMDWLRNTQYAIRNEMYFLFPGNDEGVDTEEDHLRISSTAKLTPGRNGRLR